MNLNLKKPLAFFDLETTGLDISQDRIVEIAILKVNTDGSESIYSKRLNPEIPISEESISIHGITNEDVKDCPTFKELATEIKEFIGDADLAGYNSNKFDIPFLIEEFLSNGFEFSMKDRKFVDVQNIFHKMEQRTLSAAYKFYCEKDLENAHSAEADIRATFDILKSQLDKYSEIENNVEFLHEFSQVGKNKKIDFVGRLAVNEKGEVIYNFGKHANKTIKQVFSEEPGYHRWIIDNNFPLYTKQIVKEITDKLIAEKREKNKNVENKSSKKDANLDLKKLEELKNKFKNS